MTEDEQEIVEDLATVFLKINALPVLHPSDVPEAQILIHSLQNLVLSRVGFRQLHGIPNPGPEATRTSAQESFPDDPYFAFAEGFRAHSLYEKWQD